THVLAPSGYAQRFWCNQEDVRLQAADLPLTFSHLNFNSQENFSIASIEVKRTTAERIRNYLILVEFFDQNGKFLVAAPFYNVLQRSGEIPFTVTFKRWLYARNSAFNGGDRDSSDTKILVAHIPEVFFACPVSARIAMVQLSYQDERTFSFSAPD